MGQTKADKAAKTLEDQGIPATDLSGNPTPLAEALAEGGEIAPVDDYPERSYEDALSDDEKGRLVEAGLAEGDGKSFKITADNTVLPR